MSESLKRSNRFEVDYLEIVDYLAANASADVARRFMGAVEDLMSEIASIPDLGAPLEMKRRTLARYRIVRGFPNYLIVYQRIETGILILRLVHGMRELNAIFDPGV